VLGFDPPLAAIDVALRVLVLRVLVLRVQLRRVQLRRVVAGGRV
jgi:hypothetical protein